MANDRRMPSQIRTETLATLRRAITGLKSPECMREVRKASPKVREQWADTLLRCDAARDALELAELTEIRDALMENDEELAEGVEAIDKVLGNLKKLKLALDTIAAFVDLVARAAALVV